MNQYTIKCPPKLEVSKNFSLRDETGRLLGMLHVGNDTVRINGMKIRVEQVVDTAQNGETKVF
jgi:predicted molibdopterin-dependent oxidoreductase YjgC